MIDEEKLKEVLREIVGWSGIGKRPEVRKMLLKKIDEAIKSKN